MAARPPALIDAYGGGGFKVGGTAYAGSILLLPGRAPAVWGAAGPADFQPAAFDPVVAAAADIDILIVGAGRDPAVLPKPVVGLLAGAGLRVDVMGTGPAARTYNVLAAENRRVAAALVAVP